MYDVFKLVVVTWILLWILRDKIDEPRNVKYCCDTPIEKLVNKTDEEQPTSDEPSTNDAPPANEPSTNETSTNEPSTVDDEPTEEDVLSVEDLYGDYTDLLMPSIMLRLSNNTTINNTFVPRNRCFGVVHASI